MGTDLGPLIDRNRPKLMVETLGATILSGLTSFLDLPRLSSSGSANWVGETEDATRTSASFEKLSMGPKTVSAEYEMSRRMLIQGTAIEALLRRDVGFLLAQALDLAAIAGQGVDDPLGILNTEGVQVHAMGTNGAALTTDTAADMIGLLEAADAMGSPSFLTNSKVKKAALKLKDGQGIPLGIPTVFHNEQVGFSNQVPHDFTKGSGSNLSAILYGIWADVVVGYWSSVDIVLNPYHSDVASKGGALLHAFLDADVALRHEENFVVAKDVVAA